MTAASPRDPPLPVARQRGRPGSGGTTVASGIGGSFPAG